uniref:Uncharacterized protein n=1 Tax=Haptolina ericina TaxID=156174 RepID=A0A7S3AGH1_9EUKA|mmetsp:Transcript_15527/g.34776  ORF Transcript_15527/g.34776 Transcript_15527/m.34776 type:complete len:233 (+) Transcript_15527:31-729(+)|eukprot:CAMPEP_0181213406 /NCGR_PEP_ID=MMETSP1096-20121128/24883_1 /TAXON_ID=156174 ORGANISM="Chrysochromulina ericina, Strain CCMP281" /NCGR_SAMPLE_ID=MMETSP1096 /ASSEMBLY_ACC=CAM_ASM_000453 /LENGTH=232 /DNA_ID=CAMNT_0023305033 /DNA_START=31 /DNA_END=729 /DNA_ORIENTATION=-
MVEPQTAVFFGHEPIKVVDDVINSFSDGVWDCAEAMETILNDHPDLKSRTTEIKQGIDRWFLKTQRAADKNFDKFELYTLKNILRVPADLQQDDHHVEAEVETGVTSDVEELWARLQQSLATRRELQHKLVGAQRTTQLWESNREFVRQLAEGHSGDGVRSIMEDAEHLAATQEQSWEQLRGQDAQPCAEALAAPSAPRVSALQQRFGHRRAMTSIVSVGDLQQLSSMLCAS